MMVIDPYVFAAFPGESSAAHIARVAKKLKDLIRLCVHRRYKIVVDREGWTFLERNIISSLKSPVGSPELATSLSLLRRNFLDQRAQFSLTGGRTWGIKPLFGDFKTAVDAAFGDFLAKSIGHAMQSGAQQIYLFVDERRGRNLTEHGAAPSVIVERTRWRIYVAYSGYQVARLPCITDDRNISVPWTCRFDLLLPDTGTYAFVPPDLWERRKTPAFGTQFSKAVWLDRLGNGWARPSTPPPGLPEHWDVYLQPKWKSELKLNQVNITRYGVQNGKILPGEVHHVPAGKAHVLQVKK